jgi:hypothetical protein
VAGGSRANAVLATPLALTSPHVGSTEHTQPSPYGHRAGLLRSGARLGFTQIERTRSTRASGASSRSRSAPRVCAGAGRIRLANFGVELAIGRAGVWSVSRVPDASQRALDRIGQGSIERSPVESAPAPRGKCVDELAAVGIRHDTLERLCDRLAAELASQRPRDDRQARSRQAGLRAEVEAK